MNTNDAKVLELIKAIEAKKRIKISNFRKEKGLPFIDPFHYEDIINEKSFHVITGRRGSGKTTLLIKSISNEIERKNAIIVIDAQIYRDYAYDSLLSVIVQALLDRQEEIYRDVIYFLKYIKAILPKMLYRLSPSKFERHEEKYRFALAYRNFRYLYSVCTMLIKKYETMPSEITIEKSYIDSFYDSRKLSFKLKTRLDSIMDIVQSSDVVNSKSNLVLALALASKKEIMHEDRQVETGSEKIKIRKEELIAKILFPLVGLTNSFNIVTNKQIVLYLDDFYFINQQIQIPLTQFLFDLFKNTANDCFSIKISSLPNRFYINAQKRNQYSKKDDWSEIPLDKDLSNLTSQADYLISILLKLSSNNKLERSDIISLYTNEEARLYSVIASGGVPRDFIDLFKLLVQISCNEGRGKITRENVYAALKTVKEEKDKELDEDVELGNDIIRKVLEQLEVDLFSSLKSSVLLYREPMSPEEQTIIKNLINLRYLHLINDKVTKASETGIVFSAYLIDMTFYATGQRMPQSIEFKKFWERGESHHFDQIRGSPEWKIEKEIIELIKRT